MRGQAHQLTVPIPDGVLSGDDLATVAKTFGELYRQTYGIEADVPVQLLNYRVRVGTAPAGASIVRIPSRLHTSGRSGGG